jgi:hypothetical protein
VRVAGGSWEESPTEIVADKPALPDLVLQGTLRTPLLLHLVTANVPHPANVIVERALIQVRLGDLLAPTQYHARFLLDRVSSRYFDVELPAAAALSSLVVTLSHQRVSFQRIDTNPDAPDSHVLIRIPIEPDLYQEPVMFDMRYQLSPQSAGREWSWRQLVLQPPVLRNQVLLDRARWQIELPLDWITLLPYGATVEHGWGWSGALWAPLVGVSNRKLEQWISNKQTDQANGGATAGLIYAQSNLSPLGLVLVSQRQWLLGCSLLVLAVGFVLVLAPLPPAYFWLAITVTAISVATATVLWPTIIPLAVYGAEPGVVVLLFVLLLHWLLYQRYRRRVVFMPGFTRVKAGSSLIQKDNLERRRETVQLEEPVKSTGSSFPRTARPENGQ